MGGNGNRSAAIHRPSCTLTITVWDGSGKVEVNYPDDKKMAIRMLVDAMCSIDRSLAPIVVPFFRQYNEGRVLLPLQPVVLP